eukprot:7969536-Heterocapsa_arctica.AAC.1
MGAGSQPGTQSEVGAQKKKAGTPRSPEAGRGGKAGCGQPGPRSTEGRSAGRSTGNSVEGHKEGVKEGSKAAAPGPGGDPWKESGPLR